MVSNVSLPFAFWLPAVTAPVMLGLALAPARWFGADPSSGYVYAVLAVTFCGVGNAALSLAASHWFGFTGLAAAAQAALFVVLLVIGLAGPLANAGPAGMVLMMPILFPGLAFVGAGLLRGLWTLVRGAIGE
jgi:hypothetical protein